VLFPAAAVLVFTAPAGAKLAQARAAGLGVPQGAWHQVAELVGSGTVGGDSFGGSVALSGGTALAGAPGHANNAGWAYVFQQSTEGWHQVAELVGSGTAAGDNFGLSVALSGGTALAGAPGHAGGTGEAYVFQEGSEGWHQVAELVGSGTAAGDNFGGPVAVSGGTAVVGAPSIAEGAGRAYVFQEGAEGWHQVAELVGSDTADSNVFGTSVTVSGGTALVGAPGHANNAGRAYVFQEGTRGWHQVAELVGSGTASGDNFGCSVAVSGATAVVGAWGHADRAGRAYVFQEGTRGWHQVAELVGSGTAAGDTFGSSVAVSGATAVVGAWGHANNAGRAYVFQEGTRGWHQVAELVGSGTAADDGFGSSVALSGGTAVVGASGYMNADYAGRAYVFRR